MNVFINSTVFTTDAKRDEVAGKLAPFLKTEPALVTVFHADIVAQSIRDVGGVTVAKLNSIGKLQQKSTSIGGTIDAMDDDGDKNKKVYFDDITGQVKMRATFDFNPFTGKVKLRQIKYLD